MTDAVCVWSNAEPRKRHRAQDRSESQNESRPTESDETTADRGGDQRNYRARQQEFDRRTQNARVEAVSGEIAGKLCEIRDPEEVREHAEAHHDAGKICHHHRAVDEHPHVDKRLVDDLLDPHPDCEHHDRGHKKTPTVKGDNHPPLVALRNRQKKQK
ncbi:unnamed protein product, partial [Mesorhabditis spiculigera]